MTTLTAAPPMCFLATTDAARARAFYEGVLGLRCEADEPWALVFDLAGIMLRIQKSGPFTVQPFTALGWRVDDVAATVAELAGRGVACERFPWMQQDDSHVWTAPGGARIAWFKDPDGNLLSVTQFA